MSLDSRVVLATVVAQQHNELHPKGVICGTAISPDGQPAKVIELNAEPLGVLVYRAALPSAKTNDAGEYRFENLNRGRYVKPFVCGC